MASDTPSLYTFTRNRPLPHRENLALSAAAALNDCPQDAAARVATRFWSSQPHPTAGAVAISARVPLIAYNVNLGTDNLEIATAISKGYAI